MSQAGSNLPGEEPIGANDFVANTGFAIPIGGVLNILGGTGTSTIGSGNTITINTVITGFTWNTVTSATNPNQIVVGNAYVCAGASQVDFILPLMANVGDTFEIMSFTSTFRINQNGSQQMILGAQSTTPGSGSVVSNSAGDNVEMIYVASNTFMAKSPQGTLGVN